MTSLFSSYRLIKESGLFDETYYCNTYPEIKQKNLDPLLHYLEAGARELRNPSPAFDAQSYVQQCRERGEEVENPLIHYIESRTGKPATDRPRSAPASRTHVKSASPSDLTVNLDRFSVEQSSGSERLRGYGWCLASSAISELEVKLGSASCRAHYGVPRADVAREYPRALKADHSGFEFTLEPVPQDQKGEVELVFVAKTTSGGSLERIVKIDVAAIRATGQTGFPSAVVANGAHGSPFKQPPMQLQIDAAEADAAGVLRVIGWAACLAPIASVEVFIDDTKVGTAEHGKARDDVAETHPQYPNARRSGFVLRTDTSAFTAGEHLIKVRAVASTGIFREALMPLRLSSERRRSATSGRDSKVDCFCDLIEVTTAGRVTVKGWVVGASATERISVLLNDHILGDAEIGLERPDVGNLFPSFIHARVAGFAFQHNGAPVGAGEHLIVLRHRAEGEDTDVLLPALAVETRETEVAPKASGSPERKDVLLNIDRPEMVEGAAVATIRGNLEIVGWAMARTGEVSVEIGIDGQPIKSVGTGIGRPDVQRAFPDWDGAQTAGFSALLPNRSLPKGRHTVSVSVRDQAGEATRREFRVEIDEAAETEGPWSIRRRMTPTEIELLSLPLIGRTSLPSFYIAVPLPSGAEALEKLSATLASLATQVYDDWRTRILVSDVETCTPCRQMIESFPELSARIGIVVPGNSEDLSLSEGGRHSHVMLLRAGDELSCDALLRFATTAVLRPEANFVYSDDRRLSSISGNVEAFFKPQWSPDLLLSMNYVGRAWCARAALVTEIGLQPSKLFEANDYDLVLRLTERAAAIEHIPATLLDTAPQRRDESAERKALERTLERRGVEASVRRGKAKGTFRVRRKVMTRGLVSIIIPTCAARGLIKKCIESLRTLTAYRRFEIVCIENIPADKSDWKAWLRANADTVIETTEAFNWSRFNNLATEAAHGEFLLFLNDDIEVVDAGWLDSLLAHAQRPEVGVVGPQLLYPDRRVQHAGMFLAHLGIARHAFRFSAEDDAGYFGLALTERNLISVTGACLMTRRDTFEQLGRFDETHDVINNDLDYCLRVWERGLRTIYTPHATLIHHERASRADVEDKYDAAGFSSRWRGLFVSGDPFFSPHLTKDSDAYSIEWEPMEIHSARNPVFAKSAIRRILVVKLDHIGDCVISLPAVRRLKRHFPSARISVLTGRASKAIWAFEPAVDEVIEFEFFNARSALGLVERTEEDWKTLRARLERYRFDLAVDLRRHEESRPVLQHTGARYLAGFDASNKFPWLDVAIDVPVDSALLRKRQHTADDLINLVDAIGAAAEPVCAPILQRPRPLPLKALKSVPAARRIFQKRVVCVHPAVGNEMRQWPPEHFGLLIDQLVEMENVNVIIIGAPEDTKLAEEVLQTALNRDSAWSLIGAVKLADLPALLCRCALFVGNNSGPQHIAAALGVPTIGIHSGVVDAREWGPKGASAVALQRAMTCSPCYHARINDCNRGLACMRGLLPGDVLQVCHQLLSSRSPRSGMPPRSGKREADRLAVQASNFDRNFV